MSTKLTWEIMMVEVQKGNPQMYNVLLTEISEYLKSYLRNRVRPPEAVHDLLQEILLSIHKARHTYDSSLPFKPWLFKIVQSRLIDHFRKVGRKEELTSVADDSFVETLSAEAEISQIEVSRFQKAMADLNEDQRKVLYALKFEGKSIREVSFEMALSEAAVKVTAHRAYARLYDLLEIEV